MGAFASEAETELQNLKKEQAKPGARLFIEAGEVWESLWQLCKERLPPGFVDPGNIESLYQFAETLIYSTSGVITLNVGDEQRRYELGYVETMLALWTWKIYHKLHAVKNPLLRAPYESLFHAMLDNDIANRVAILTTNYDLVPEFTALACTTECRCDPAWDSPEGYWQARVDEKDRERPDRVTKIPIVKLHGSVDLFTVQSEDGIRLRWAGWLDKNVRLGDGFKPAALQLNALVKLRRQFGETLTPAIVPPTFAKARRFSWVDGIWRQGCRAIAQAKDILFIGYSLPPSDGHMRGLVAAGLGSKSQMPRVWVANRCERAVEDFARWFDIPSERQYKGPFEEMGPTLQSWFGKMA